MGPRNVGRSGHGGLRGQNKTKLPNVVDIPLQVHSSEHEEYLPRPGGEFVGGGATKELTKELTNEFTNVEKQMVLVWFRSNMLNSHWCHCIFVHNR